VKARTKRAVVSGVLILVGLAWVPLFAQVAYFNVPSEDAGKSIPEFGRQAGVQIIAPGEMLHGLVTPAIKGSYDVHLALEMMLKGTDLVVDKEEDGVITISARNNGCGEEDTVKSVKREAMRTASFFALLLGAVTTPACHAQGTTSSPDSAVTVETVVVTATKRAKSVEEIPAAISAITGAEIERRASQNLSDIVALVPGVNLTAPAGNAERISIRGISGEANTNPTSGILFGDISFNDSYVPHTTLDPNPFDMQNVEVLKGPQGTLFGASALNGAIRYVPNEPELGVISGKYYVQGASVSQGNDPWSIGGMLNVPIIDDSLAVRVVAFDSSTPGWIDNILTKTNDSNAGHQFGGRAMVAWRPLDRLKVNLTYAMQRTRENDISEADNANGDLSSSDRLRPSPQANQYDLLSLNAQYEFDAFSLISETGYIRKDDRGWNESTFSVVPGGQVPLIDNTGDDRSKTVSQEIRLVSNDDPSSRWSWVAGVFASRQDITQNGTYELGSPALPTSTTAGLLDLALGQGAGGAWLALGQPPYSKSHINVSVTEVAGFFDVTRKLGDSWEVSVGGRLYETTSGGVVDNTGLLLALTGFPNGQLLDDKVKNSGFNPKVSLTWHATDNAMVYAAVSKGYRVGGVQWGTSGFNATAPAPALFKTDTIWNYELGLRSKWLDDSLQIDVTAFYENWKSPQVLVFVSNGLGAYIDNVGRVESKGIEASAEYMVPWLPGLRARASGTYNYVATAADFQPAVGSQLLPKGSPWPLSPKWQTSSTLDYQHTVGDWYFGASATDQFLSHAIYGINQPDKVFGYNAVDAQVRVGFLNLPTQPELALIANNVFDVRGINTAYSGSFWHEVNYIQPRTVMLRLSGSF